LTVASTRTIGKPPRWRRVLHWLVGLSLALGLLYIGIRHYHVEHRLTAWWQDPKAEDASPGQLQAYVTEIDALPLPGVLNLSGLAWDDEAGHLVAVLNKPPTLLVLDRDGNQLATYRLRDFHDTEGIAALGEGWFAVAEERRAQLAFFHAPAGRGNGEIDHADAVILNLDLHPSDPLNKGFEGLAYDPNADVLFVVREDSPVRLYEIAGLAALRRTGSMQALRIRDRSSLLANLRPSDDLSSVEVDPHSGHLLLLSERGQRLTEVRRDGSVAGVRHFGGVLGEETPMPRPEGVTMAPDRSLFVVSEPNLFYRFAPVTMTSDHVKAAP